MDEGLIKIRKLDVEDLLYISDLLNHQDEVFGVKKDAEANKYYLQAIEIRLKKHSDSFVLMGCFNENKLVCMAGGVFGQRTPSWTMCYVHKRNDSSHAYITTLGQTLDALLEHAESRGFYRFDFACALRGTNVYNPKNYSSLLTRISKKLKRYEFFTEAVIAKGTKPPYDYHWELIGSIEPPTNVAIRIALLREEERLMITPLIRERGE